MSRICCRAGATTAGLLAKKADTTPDEQTKDMEKKVHALIEESAKLQQKGDTNTALEKAMEAAKRERALTRFREQNNLADSVSRQRP